MGDRLATTNVARKVGELGPRLTQCRLGRGLPPYSKWHPDPFNRLATINQCYRQDQQEIGPVA